MHSKYSPRASCLWLLSLTTLGGCQTNRYYIEVDGGTDAARDSSMDTQTPDAFADGAAADVRVGDAVASDAGETAVDAGATDAASETGPGMCARADRDECLCAPMQQTCSTECGNSLCIDRGCGNRCAPIGAPCLTMGDCPTGAACGQGRFGGICVNLDPNARYCQDTRLCGDGYACRGMNCEPHIIFCNANARCPVGFACAQTPEARSVCVKLYRTCDSDAACPTGMRCADVDGDGDRECGASATPVANGGCGTNADCSERRLVCGNDPLTGATACQHTGPCASSFDCDEGFECRDYWGDGFRECVAMTGSTCANSTTCSATQVCAPSVDGVLRCQAAVTQ